MQRLELQFYSFFTIVLCGAVLGLLFDLLRATRGRYRPNPWLGALADLLFWAVATAAIVGSLFFGNWADLRFYVVVGTLLGIGLYYWLASPVVIYLVHQILGFVEWLIDLVCTLFLRLIWAPVLAVCMLIWGAARLLWQWARRLCEGIWRLLSGLAMWLARPLNGPYRCLRLRYLLTKRRWKRRLREWLLGPQRPRRR